MLKSLNAVAAAFVLAGCAAQPVFQEPVLQMQGHFTQGKALPSGAEPQARWWTALEDPVLASLIERALERNLDIRVAGERLEQARAGVRGSLAARLPGGGASAGMQRRQLSAAESAGAPQPGQTVSRYDAGFDASWEIDLFGRLASQVEAAAATQDAFAARLEGVRLAVAAEVARAYFELASALERRSLALDSRERQRFIARLVSVRVKEGFAEAVDEARSQAELSLAESVVPALDAEIAAASGRIAVLLGENPSAFEVPRVAPRDPWTLRRLAVGSPDRLLDTRPDIREAEERLRAFRASVESVRADFLPRLTVTGFLGFIAGGAGTLGEVASESWLVAPRIGLPLFDLPRIQARLDAARAEERQALLDYHQRILVALEDVETSLARYVAGQERLQALRRRAAQAETASRLAGLRYEAGRSDFLELLEAERTANAARGDLSLAVSAQRVAVVGVFKAFGAGWTPTPEPAAALTLQ